MMVLEVLAVVVIPVTEAVDLGIPVRVDPIDGALAVPIRIRIWHIHMELCAATNLFTNKKTLLVEVTRYCKKRTNKITMMMDFKKLLPLQSNINVDD